MDYRTGKIDTISLAAFGSMAHAADLPVKATAAAPDAPFFFVNDKRRTYAYQFTATSPPDGQHFDALGAPIEAIKLDEIRRRFVAGSISRPCRRSNRKRRSSLGRQQTDVSCRDAPAEIGPQPNLTLPSGHGCTNALELGVGGGEVSAEGGDHRVYQASRQIDRRPAAAERDD